MATIQQNSDQRRRYTAEDYAREKAEKEKIQAETRAKREAERQAAIRQAYESAQKRSTSITGDKKTREAAKNYVKFAEERYTPQALGKTPQPQQQPQQVANIFGYTQGLSPTQPPQKVLTPQERMREFGQQFDIRRTFPIETIAIPQNQKIYIKEQPTGVKNDTRSTSTNNNLDSLYSRSGLTQEETARQKRIEGLLQREQKLVEFESNLIGRLGLEKGRRDTAPLFLLETGKAIPRTFIEGGVIITKGLGRIGFVAEAATLPEGRKELGIDAGSLNIFSREGNPFRIKEISKGVAESFNPTTPEGLVNIGLTALAVKGVAKGIKTAREPFKITSEEAGTLRVSKLESVRDITDVKVKALQGKKPIEIAGKGTQEFIQVSEKQFIIKGSGKIGKTPFESRGLATKVEPQYSSDLGGYDVINILKTSKGKSFLDVTQSATLTEEPIVSIKTLSRTLELPKNKPITEAKPSSISAGSTGELFVEDIFSPDKNIFRKEVVTESGEQITTTYMGTNRFSIGAKTFEEQFRTIRNKAPEFKSSGDFAKEISKASEISTGTGTLKLELKTQELPTQTELLLKTARQEAQTQAYKIKASSVSKSATSLGLLTGQKTRQESRAVVSAKPTTKLSLVPKVESKPVVSAKPISISQSISGTKPITKSINKPFTITKPSLITGTITEPKPSPRPMPRTTTIVEPIVPPPETPPFLLPKLKGMNFPDRQTKPSRTTGKKSSKYTPSVEAIAFNIYGKKATLQEKTGLGLRPMQHNKQSAMFATCCGCCCG